MLVVGLRLPVVQSEACSKCGYFKKSGKRSCCAVGGAWFKDCGDANNANVSHTWVEGVEACSDFAGESSGEAAMQGMLRHETTMGGMLRAAGQWNVSSNPLKQAILMNGRPAYLWRIFKVVKILPPKGKLAKATFKLSNPVIF